MNVALEPFARTCVESAFGRDLPMGVRAAVVHYARRLRLPEPPAAVPAFRRGAGTGIAADTNVEFPVAPEVEEMLAEEARRQGVPIDRIVGHAVFVYFADLDRARAGRHALRGGREAVAFAASPS